VGCQNASVEKRSTLQESNRYYYMILPENRFGGRALWNLFLKFLKFDILKFQKIPGKILEVQNDVFYSPAKFQNEIVCIPAYTKKINSEKS
jgi:hypothetical protein